MTRLKTFHHVAAGLLQSFVSRNNDVGGFWAFGVLYGEASAPDFSFKLSLLDGGAAPSTPASAIVASTYAAFLQRALQAKGIGLDEIEEARVDVQFNTALRDRPINRDYQGDPFVCTVTLRSVQGKEAVRTAVGRCVRTPWGRFSGRVGH
ncbi:hypothetical protein F2P45_27300 [Massilia sp. CCM 8733]|uniref:Uncharacterized protein n=1 Tax=Massilia mucilaginosa TaxID=2609282 RepID=A0ABX0P0V1_9BURK|nr:hypothetical protein [Massilia mucilaginosa]NHZ92684.1 hypothetical protein [Massilia mucilaginosa]